MYSILFNSEYICQGGKLQRRLGSMHAFQMTKKDDSLPAKRCSGYGLLLLVTRFVDGFKGKRNAIIAGCHPFAGYVLGNCFVLVL
jgi:hypothetical protein